MSFFDHLNELRKRIIYSAAAILLGAFVGFAVAKQVLAFVARPMVDALRAAHLEDKLIFTHPAGYLNLVMTLGLYLGVVMASPVVLYQIWLFVAPGLYKHEKKAVAAFIVPSVGLFFTGIAFAYYVILPYLLKFLVGFQGNGPFTPLISIEEYFDLVLIVLLGVGVVFELPMLILVLSLFGIVTPQIPVEELPLRDPHHCDRSGHHHAHARRHDHAGVHGADDPVVPGWHRGLCVRCAQQARAKCRRAQEGVDSMKRARVIVASAACLVLRAGARSAAAGAVR